MVQVFLVDDERPALKELEHNLEDYPEIEITGMFTDPKAALENIEKMHPEVVFLDINMPRLTGMEAALRILDISPETEVVFVTAYSQYALEAFEVHALDYVLKPVEKEQLDKTIEHILSRKPRREKHAQKKLHIKCFGRFLIEWEEEAALKWRTEKTKELFAFLLYDHGRGRSKEELLDKLWTEDDPEKAIRQLYNGVYYIRKALEEGLAPEVVQQTVAAIRAIKAEGVSILLSEQLPAFGATIVDRAYHIDRGRVRPIS